MTGKLSGYDILSVNLHPVNYIPLEGKLSYYKKINVVISYTLKRPTLGAASFRNLNLIMGRL